MTDKNFDLVVIGSGPGGYVAAIRASQLGMKVAVIERDRIGGVCLNWGCIPTKALLRSAEVYHNLQRREEFGLMADNISFDFQKVIRRSRRVADRLSKGVEFLFKKNNISTFRGTGRIVSSNEVAVINENGNPNNSFNTKNILIATGARPRSIPNVEIDGQRVISSKEAMTLEKVPKSIIVIGAGAIGVEFAHFYNTFGCKVTLVEMMPNILPIEDKEITENLTKSFKKSKIVIYTNSIVQQVTTKDENVKVTISTNNAETNLEAEVALMAIGVQGNNESLGLEELNVNVEKSWIKVDSNYQTNVSNIYAIGDSIGPPWLAHVASSEGIFVVEKMVGLNCTPINYESIPGCTYCQPQVASIGLTEERALQMGYQLKIGRFPFQANGKSLALGEREGMAKLIFDVKSGKLIGAHIIHAEATELINELSVVKHAGITGHNLIKTIHAHPTLSETLMEAAAVAYDEAIHI